MEIKPITEKYQAGEIVSIYSDNLHRKRLEGRAKLVERLQPHPTNNDFALASWRILFVGRDDKVHPNETECVRPILEVGVPNQNPIQRFDASRYLLSAAKQAQNEAEEGQETSNKGGVGQKSAGRGRPEGPMNELKARNLIRDYKQGKITEKEQVLPAVGFLISLGQEKYVEKHFFSVDKSAKV